MKALHIYVKLLFYRVVLPGYAFVALAGCIREDITTMNEGDGNDAMVKFSIYVPGNNLPSTRAISGMQECQVKTVDILAFDGNNFLYHVSVAEGDITQTAGRSVFAVSLLKSASPVKFMFLANASDIIQSAYSASIITGSHSYASVQASLIKTAGSAWNADLAGNGSFAPLPMWGEKTFAVTGSTLVDDIDLFRMLAKVNLSSVAEDFVLEEVWLYNPMDKGYLIPHGANWDPIDGKAYAPSLGTGSAWNRTGNMYRYTDISTSGTDPYECHNQIYTFETSAGDRDDNSKNTFLVVGGRYLGASTTYYRIDFALEDEVTPYTYNYHPILRNHRYEFTITAIEHQGAASPDAAASERPINTVELLIEDEFIYRYYSYNGQYFLGAEDETMWYWWEETSGTINVKSDYPVWTATLSIDRDNENAGVPSWITPEWSGEQTRAETLTYTMSQNTSHTDDRVAYLHIKAGVLSLTVKIVQEKKFHFPSISITPFRYGYVGAFWRADQTGERLIRIPYSTNGDDIAGDWTATVVEGRDWIFLDPYLSYDTGIEWMGGTNPEDMNINDITYQVTGESRKLFGNCGTGPNDMIYFRIGLTEPFSPTRNVPARYGVIEVKYNNNSKTALIFVRQGHDPDYLMRRTDPTGSGSSWSSATRPRAVKYSPYNITSKYYFPDAGLHRLYGGTSWTDHPYSKHPVTSENTIVFTEYPSQAGAMFKWAMSDTESNNIHAFHPVNPDQSGTIMSWTTYAFHNSTWKSVIPDNELCPPGYKRPNDGFIEEFVVSTAAMYSEQRQSLWLNPQNETANNTDNSLWGYYADGFFDRREIVDPNSVGPIESNSSVGLDGFYAAYMGRLFYNPGNYASVFFPAAGSRQSDGQLRRGGSGMYWNTCVYDSDKAWLLNVSRSDASNDYASKHYGLMIRCVMAEIGEN